MRIAVFATSLSLLLACGKDGTPGGGDDQTGDDGDDTPDTVLTGEVHTLTFPSKTLQPGEESTECIWVRLPNEAEIKVHKVHNELSDVSHHLIVYKDDKDTTEQLTPVECQPFTGALNPSGMISPLMITQKMDELLELPNHVAYTFTPNQMIKLEMHYFNGDEVAKEATAKVEFAVAEAGTINREASILFIGSPDIQIPAHGQTTLKQFFTMPDYMDFTEENIFAITGHTHKLGTNMQVRIGEIYDDPTMESVYAPEPFMWSEPETARLEPNIGIPADGGGFEFECAYNNTTNNNVGFGEGADDEMCFFWAYYHWDETSTTKGSKVCIHTEDPQLPVRAAGWNVCCPGDALCSYVDDYFEN